jgi:hypothetical protein
MRALTLLIQLFGRETIDRLSAAGFTTNDTIADAGPERLARDAQIQPPLARRIVAVASEARETDAAVDHEAPLPEAPVQEVLAQEMPPQDTTAPARHTRRPLRRPASALAARAANAPGTPAASQDHAGPRAVAPSAAPRKRAARPQRRPAKAEEEAPRKPPAMGHDPFVDDVGLVSWMGFASKQRSGQGMAFPVADEILDPVPRAIAEVLVEEPVAASPAPVPAKPPAATTRAPASVEGSFWSFGTRPGRTADRRVEAQESPASGPAGPRRRSHDGH